MDDLPIYIFKQGMQLPEGQYYLVCKDGIYINKETKIGNGLIKVKNIPFLQEADTSFNYTLPTLPSKILKQAYTFFNKIYALKKSECYLTMYYSETAGFRLHCPSQSVSHGSVQYNRNDQIPLEERKAEKYSMVGTIHSHCNFSAFHSGVDVDDEATFDGFHITIGHVDRKQFSLASSLAVNGNRMEVAPIDCIEGIAQLNQDNSNQESYHHRHRVDLFYQFLEEHDKISQKDVKMIEEEWIPKVTSEHFFTKNFQ